MIAGESRVSDMGAKKTEGGRATSPQRAMVAPLEKASRELRAQWTRSEREIERLRAAGAEAFDDLWEAVHRVIAHDPPLYLGGGMRNKGQFIAKVLPGESARTVARNILVAVCFTPADEERHGLAFLEEVAKYEQARTGRTEVPRALALSRMRIEVRSGREKVRKRASECTLEEVRAARTALGGRKPRPLGPEATAIVRAIPKGRAFASTKVAVDGDRATFRDVPLAELAAFGRAIARVKLPRP